MAIFPSLHQITALVQFLEKNPGIARGILRTHEAKLQTKRKWSAFAHIINSMEGAKRDGRGWAKYWAEKKCNLKKQYFKQRAATMRGEFDGPTMSALDKRLIALLGPIFNKELAERNPLERVHTHFHSVNTKQSSDEAVSIDLEDDRFPDIDNPVLHSEAPPSVAPGPSRDSPAPGPSRDETHSPVSDTKPRPIVIGNRHFTPVMTAPLNMERIAKNEERRVEAETMTARAVADVASSLDRNAVALENIASAMGQIASALSGLDRLASAVLEVANRFPIP